VLILEEGIVSRYGEDKGLGFICAEDGKEVIVQRSAIEMEGYKFLNVGDHVIFEVTETFRGLEAKKVRKTVQGEAVS